MHHSIVSPVSISLCFVLFCFLVLQTQNIIQIYCLSDSKCTSHQQVAVMGLGYSWIEMRVDSGVGANS